MKIFPIVLYKSPPLVVEIPPNGVNFTVKNIRLPEDGRRLMGAIIHGLASVSRYGGQTPLPYSVAEHSVILCNLARRAGLGMWAQRYALLHDAPEAMGIGDVNGNLKKHFASDLRQVDDAFFDALWSRFGPLTNGEFTEDARLRVKALDQQLPAWEIKEMGNELPDWYPMETSDIPTDIAINYWRPAQAEKAWRQSWYETSGYQV